MDPIRRSSMDDVDMTTIADRYREVAQGFTDRVRQLSDDDWDRPTPCEGWVVRDIVDHLAEWVPAFLGSGSDVRPPERLTGESSAATWQQLDEWIQSLLDDPSTAAMPFSHPMAGSHRLDEAIDRFVLGDVLIHTWDVARAAGLDERLPVGEVARMVPGLEAMGDALEQSGQYGRAVEVPPGADDQTRLIAATGRVP
jgi:uncharacterized protein (TIGR03086 family)